MPLDLISQNIFAKRSYVYMTRADGHEPPIDSWCGQRDVAWSSQAEKHIKSSPASQFPKLSSCACVCVSWVNISTKTKCLFLMIVWYSVSNSLWDLLARLSVSLVDQHASCVVARSPASQEEKIQFAVEALRRASAKFAGRQKVHVSNKFGFTKYTKKDGNALNC